MLYPNQQAQEATHASKQHKAEDCQKKTAQSGPEAVFAPETGGGMAYVISLHGGGIGLLGGDGCGPRASGGCGLIGFNQKVDRLGFSLLSGENSRLAALGIVDQSALPRQAEEALVEEYVHFRKENSMAGMGVVPADDAEIGVLPVHQKLNVLPGIGGEGDLPGMPVEAWPSMICSIRAKGPNSSR